MKARLLIDGGSRGNPGPAAYGFILETYDGEFLEEYGETIGITTNNVAEYRGLIAGLDRAKDFLFIRELEVFSDSELLVKQMTGEYRVKNIILQSLWVIASELAQSINKVTYNLVSREDNKRADRLVNHALNLEKV